MPTRPISLFLALTLSPAIFSGCSGAPASLDDDDIAAQDDSLVTTGPQSNNLVTNGSLLSNEWLDSANGLYRLTLQSDGNLVLYQKPQTALWATATNGKGGARLTLQSDGNLVLYTSSNQPIWASSTVGSNAGQLRVRDDGSLALLSGSAVVWSVGGGTAGGTGSVVDSSTLTGKIMAGYQGWFMTSGDGAGVGWRHWASSTPTASNVTFDMWPDLREYGSSELTSTSFKYKNGNTAKLYSAYNATTVKRHVQWMQDYGIDGVFVQRFVSETGSMKGVRDKVLQNVRTAAEAHGRVFANMYDISGASSSTLIQDIKNDWMHLVDDLQITQSDRYLRHKGKPVVSLWGFGVSGRPGTASQAASLISWFKTGAPAKYRATVKLGVDGKWRSHSSSWLDVYHQADVLSPWNVGRYNSVSSADSWKTDRIVPDLADLGPRGINYIPVVFPGFSWSNLMHDTSLFNQVPRNGGKFLWRQFYNAQSAGCNMVYVAMFDEVDEGTAIYKIAENSSQTPTTGKFLTLDADGTSLPSDWYLRLTGSATKMLRGKIPLTSTIPISP